MPLGRNFRYRRGNGDGDLKNLKRERLSVLIALSGLGFILFMAHILQTPVHPEKEKIQSQVKFDVKKQQKKIQQIQRPKPKPKKTKSTVKKLKPSLNLNVLAGGIDLGIDVLGLAANDSSLLAQGDSVMTADTVDQLPKVQYREPIDFPEKAKLEKLVGSITANILVDTKGRVERVKLLESNPPGIFETAATEGLKKWTFSPAEYQGRLVSVWVKQKVEFKLN